MENGLYIDIDDLLKHREGVTRFMFPLFIHITIKSSNCAYRFLFVLCMGEWGNKGGAQAAGWLRDRKPDLKRLPVALHGLHGLRFGDLQDMRLWL